MADQDQKPQDAKSAQVRSPAELVALYDRLQDLEWNHEKEDGKIVKAGTAYKNPTMVMRTLVSFGRVCARMLEDGIARLAGAEGKIAALEAARAAGEARLAAAENKIAALEAARASDEERQGAVIEAAVTQFASMPPDEAAAARAQLEAFAADPGCPATVRARIQSALERPSAPAKPESAPPPQDAAVVPIKPPKKPAKADSGGSQGGGAA